VLRMRYGAHIARVTHVSPASQTPDVSRSQGEPAPGGHVVLILSTDPVAAALLGALVETLGYLVRFYQTSETPEDAMRRVRPSVAMLDCQDPTLVAEDLLGRARMRGISVIVFGTSVALRRVRELAREHALDSLVMPTTLDQVDEVIRRAVEKAC